jgi:DNA-binding response OmpR family regulator
MCETVKASNFKAAKEFLETEYFDMTILDIMGVEGFQLLEIATQREVTAVMLTAHALSPDNIVKSLSNLIKKVRPLICPKKKWSTSPPF